MYTPIQILLLIYKNKNKFGNIYTFFSIFATEPKLIINGLQHDEDSATFDAFIGNQAVDVLKGGELKTKIVYKVKGYPTTGYLKYDRSYGPTLQRVNYSFT